MVAYTFKPSFFTPIVTLEKRQTIRLPRKRRTVAGDDLQFFSGPRMRPVRWGAASCLAVRDVRLDFTGHGLVQLDGAIEIEHPDELDAFAIRDGFNHRSVRPWTFMAGWWATTHPDNPVFQGDLVDWGDTFVRAPLA